MRLIKWKSEGRKVIIIDTEGNHQDKSIKMSIPVAPDLYCFWNNEMLSEYRSELEQRGSKVVTLGFLRGDLLTKRFLEVFPSKQNLLQKYGLDPNLKTITIATSTQDSHFSDERIKNKTRKRKKSYPVSASYSDIITNMKTLRKKTEDLIKTINSYSPNINIAIKPHPNETVVYWHKFISENCKSNTALVVGEPINHLFKISDLHIAQNVCTTTTESLISGIPTAEIHTAESEKLYGKEHLYLMDYIIQNKNDIKKVIDIEIFQKNVNSHKNNTALKKYVEKFFFSTDGYRCSEYAKYLRSYMKDNPFNSEF